MLPRFKLKKMIKYLNTGSGVKLPYLLLLFLVGFNSCNESDGSSCELLEELNLEKMVSLDFIHDKIAKWKGKRSGRISFVQGHYSKFKKDFFDLRESIESRDKNLFKETKTSIDNTFQIMFSWVKFDRWKNKDYFWILENCASDLNKLRLTVDEDCEHYLLFDCLDIEDRLFSTLYMMGYSDEFGFNKVEAVVFSEREGDSIKIFTGIMGYDSTMPALEKIVWVNKPKMDLPDTLPYRIWQSFKLQNGVNKFRGLHRFYQRGEIFEKEWVIEIEK